MLLFEPLSPWSLIAVIMSILTIVMLLVAGIWQIRRFGFAWSRMGGSPGTRRAVVILTVLAAISFAVAALNPLWIDEPITRGFHLQVSVDVSDSVLRVRGGWQEVRKQIHDYISRGVNALPDHLRERCTAGILTFRNNTYNAWSRDRLEKLPDTFMQLDENSFASGDGTDVENGLREAGISIGKSGSPGAVLLVSDGNQTSGNALIAAKELARRGIPVHIIPVTSQGPAVSITDANLPQQTRTDAMTFVRGLLLNRYSNDRKALLALIKDTEPDDGPGEMNTGSDSNINQPVMAATIKEFSLPSGQWVRLRWPVVFENFGLQFIDLQLTPENSTQPPHRRRFFTYVKRPPRILVVGGDNRWIEAIPADVAKIITMGPDFPVTRSLLKNIDAVVVNSVPSEVLSEESQLTLVRAVEQEGIGLFMINGEHLTSDENDTVIMSYKGHPLDRILPVGGGPWPEDEQPPGRQVVIMIDTSGSMGAGMRGTGGKVRRIEKAREIAQYIISELLGPRDRLDLITFTTGAGHIVKDRLMDDEGKRFALDQLSRIHPGGGTDPGKALMLLKDRKMSNCGLIVISDGEFHYLRFRPDCRATVFEVDNNRQSNSKALQQLADPIPVGVMFNPASISIPYFEESRVKFFKRGMYQAMTMDAVLPRHQRLPVPPLDLEGTAVTHLRDWAILNAVRPKYTHPVLVFGERNLGTVGVLTTSIPHYWAKYKEGKEALKAWFSRIIPFMDRSRYDFKLEDLGESISLRISLVSKNGKIPEVDRIMVVLHFPGNETIAAAMQPDDFSPGTFEGEIRMDRIDKPRRGLLAVREFGPEALARDQRIPIMIPPRTALTQSPTTEANTYGQNRALLQQIAQIGGGYYNPRGAAPFFKENPVADKGQPLWWWFVLVAVFCYLTSIALKRWNP